jgi:hypothetical protein
MSELQNKLSLVFQELNLFLDKKRLISRLELRLKIKELIAKHNFSESEKAECGTLYEFPLHQFIFLTVTSGKEFSIQAPLLHEKLPYKQMAFHHSHSFKVTDDLLEQAYSKVCQLQLELEKKIIRDLLEKVNYKVKEVTPNSIIAERVPFTLKCLLFCSISRLDEKIRSLELTSNDALIIPPGISIDPFIKFYQQHSNDILLTEASVWLIDTETEAVSRFIGFPKDKNLLIHFTRSQLATLIERNWRPNLSEDF